jgi:hypothetical protein
MEGDRKEGRKEREKKETLFSEFPCNKWMTSVIRTLTDMTEKVIKTFIKSFALIWVLLILYK